MKNLTWLQKNIGLEYVFSENHIYRDVLYYDRYEGKYYDRSTDMYLFDVKELKRYGVKI